jgi:hypothetical protein
LADTDGKRAFENSHLVPLESLKLGEFKVSK